MDSSSEDPCDEFDGPFKYNVGGDEDPLSSGYIQPKEILIEGGGGNHEFSISSESPLKFEFLTLQSGDDGGVESLLTSATRMMTGEGEGDGDEEEDDPIAALEAAIEADKPKTEASPEWQQMLEAVQREEEAGGPDLVPEAPSAAAAAAVEVNMDVENDDNTTTATTTPYQGNSAIEKDEEEVPILLHPEIELANGNGVSDSSSVGVRGSSVATALLEDDLAGSGTTPSAPPPSPSPVELETEPRAVEQQQQQEEEEEEEEEEQQQRQHHIPFSTTTFANEQEEHDPAQALEDLRRRSFAILQPICSRLLVLRDDAMHLTALLHQLTQIIQALEPAGMQACVDYVIFPLQVAVEAIATTRGSFGSTSDSSSSSSAAAPPVVALPALKSDKAAEAALGALLALLQRSRCSGGDQLLSLLQRLSCILVLPRKNISEEVRLLTLKVVSAALREVDCDESLRESLREESSAPLLGHLSSLFLNIAAAELEAKSTGSKFVRKEAFRAFHTLLKALNTPETLSFSLPGFVTGLAKALLVAGGGSATRRSSSSSSRGPAASGAATVEVLQCLSLLLVATLGNVAVEGILNDSALSTSENSNTTTTDRSWAVASADDAMAELLELSLKSKSSSLAEKTNLKAKEEDKKAHLTEISKIKSSSSSSPPPPPEMKVQPRQQEQQQQVRLRVDRTEEWVRTSADKIKDLLKRILPPLGADGRPAIREALVNTCATLMTECSAALSECRPFLTDILFALAQDEWPSVSSTAKAWLSGQLEESTTKTSTTTTTFYQTEEQLLLSPLRAAAEASLLPWLKDLPAALRCGDEAGKAHALKIITCLETCSPKWTVAHLLSNSRQVAQLVAVLADCFALDADAAGQLLAVVPEGGGVFTRQKKMVELSENDDDAAAATNGGGENLNSAVTAVVLPRMPLGLHIISTKKTYEAVARVVRKLAEIAVEVDDAGGSGGGTALRSLVDACLQHLHEQQSDSGSGARKQKGAGAGVKKNKKPSFLNESRNTRTTLSTTGNMLSEEEETFWQLSAAQTIFVLTELFFGAAPLPSTTATTTTTTSTAELESLVALVLPEIVDERIWALPTSITGSSNTVADSNNTSFYQTSSRQLLSSSGADDASSSDVMSLKVRGCNALLQRAVLDCIGTSARALGTSFSSTGRLLRTVLLPTLEKLNDPCKMVSSAAETAVQVMCAFGGESYRKGGLRLLVAENADYIVDGLCKQLRQPELFPRAPLLFAGLLRQGGVAPGLIPLLAEPARQALMGISIVARRRRPEHVLSFVLCLREISRGAGLVAHEAAVEVERLSTVVKERRAVFLLVQQDDAEGAGQGEEEDEEQEKGGGVESIDDIGRYFSQHNKAAAKKKKENNAAEEESTFTDPEDMIKVPVTLSEWNEVQIARKRAGSCATLVQSAADAAGPLTLSSSLPVAVQSLRACSDALEALKHASSAVEQCTKEIDPHIIPPGGVIGPTDTAPATLLPSIHLLWSPLMGALRDWRVAVVENALSVITHLAKLSGSFISRRFAQDAWPILLRLLKEGPSQQRIIAPGQDDLSTPAVVQRAQRAVLACLREMAAGDNASSGSSTTAAAAVVVPLAASALFAVAEVMGEGHPPAVREDATAAFIALAGLDPDAAWALLAVALRFKGTAAATAAKLKVSTSCTRSGSSRSSLPHFSALCPVPPTERVPRGLRTCGDVKLEALSRQVSQMSVPWHSDVYAFVSVV